MPDNAQWNPFDPTTFDHEAQESEKIFAPVAFGKLGLATRYLMFHGKGNAPTEVTMAEYQRLEQRSRGMELQVTVDATEFNPTSQFTYQRKISLSSKDWRKTVAPSILTVFGDYAKMKPGCYVEIADVAQIDKPEYNVPRFTRVFPSVTECAAAWKEKFGGVTPTPNGNGHASAIPAQVIAGAKVVWNLVKSDDTFRQVAAGDANYNVYPIEELLQAVKA